MHKFIFDVKVGDVILEGGSTTKVTQVDTEICKHHTHINGKDCYDNATEVRVKD